MTLFCFVILYSRQKFIRNNTADRREIVMNNLSSPVIANMIRIYPKRSIDDTCLRLEIYGCQGK